MSYDLTIAAHEKPTREQVEMWAHEQGLSVAPEAGADFLTIEKPTKRGDAFVCTLDGPHAAESEDFEENLAAACLAPRWMMQVSVPYSSPKANVARARSLAGFIAEQNQGAAFDPQEDELIWPRGRRKPPPGPTRDEATTKIGLEWFLPPGRFEAAPETMIGVLRRLCPEALPTRYGQWEPPQHRFDSDDPDKFVRFLLENEDGAAFWFASRPSFGGSYFAPHADQYAGLEDEAFRIAHFQVNFDGRVLDRDPHWREAVVDLFVRMAVSLGAFYAAAQVEPGWTVTRNNRLFTTAANVGSAEYFLRGRLWQGLPPVPLWLSWFGDPYRLHVADALRPDLLQRSLEHHRPKNARMKRLLRRRDVPPLAKPLVTERPEGLLVRLSDEPLPQDQLPPLPLPPELAYRTRPATVNADGSRTFHAAEREDQAEVIPALR